ncbi:MAG: IS1634 family transposase [Burkholderiaceae bacterium]|nr:IS1634 family transposase [Burkholderiaceae bacterium]
MYLQLAENVWDHAKGRSQARIVYSCGRADDAQVVERLRRLAKSILRRCSAGEIVADCPDWRLVCAWPYGDVYALEAVWRRLGIDAIVRAQTQGRRFGFEMERALFAPVANRACAPASKLYCHEQWLREDVRIEGTQALELHQLYRAMDFLEANKTAIEQAIFYQVADLLNLDVDIVFYDTTSLHFEIDDEDEGDTEGRVRGSVAAGAKAYAAPRKRGHSKNGRGDAPQIVVGLAVTRDGFPVRHWVFPGNTVDVTTVAKVKADLKGWQLTRCLFVGDAGMVSKANFQALAKGGGKYLMAMPMRRGDEVTEAVLSRPGRYRKIADNLEVKEVVVGDGERRRRYAVCFNPQEARRQRAYREERIRELEAELACLPDQGEAGHSKRVCALRSSARYGRLLKETKRGLAIDRQAIAELERFDGKFVVHSNDDTLTAEDMALGYKQQQRVEEAWRTMKSGLRMRPVFHWAPHRIHAHIAITVLSLLLERVIEHACQDTWRNVRDDLKRIQLAQLSSPNGTVWQVTEPTTEAANRLKALKIKPPPAILKLD